MKTSEDRKAAFKTIKQFLFELVAAFFLYLIIVVGAKDDGGIWGALRIIFFGFFVYPFVALHEIGHGVGYFLFSDDVEVMISIEKATGNGMTHIDPQRYGKGFPNSSMMLMGPFVNFVLFSLFLTFLLKKEVPKRAYRRISEKQAPLESIGEVYAIYGVLFNLGMVLMSLIPMAKLFNAAIDNDGYQFLELNGIDPIDLSMQDLTPKLLYYLTGAPALITACFILILLASDLISRGKRLAHPKWMRLSQR